MSIFSKLSKAADRAAGGFAAEPYDPATQIPVIRSSICTGEKVAGFKDRRSGRFTEVMLICSQKDLDEFKRVYHVDHLTNEY